MSKQSLRELTIGKKIQFPTEIVVIDEARFEVRAPSIKERGNIIRAAGLTGDQEKDKTNAGEFPVYLVIFLTYDPETGERVFDLADKEALMETPAGGFVDLLAKAANRMMAIKSEDGEAPGKN